MDNGFRIPFEEEEIDDETHPPPKSRAKQTRKKRKPIYKGESVDDVPNGKGRMKWPNGDIYIGNWQMGERHGEGKMIFKTKGITYDGQWENDTITHGTMKFPGRIRYVGEFRNGDMNGKGTMTWPSGTTYTGEWKDDKRDGQGTIEEYENGELVKTYVGAWRGDKKNGHGILTWADGDNYTGEFKDDHRQGHGVMLEETTIYDGNWENDNRHGPGLFRYPSSNMSYHSTWRNSIMIDARVNEPGDFISGHIGGMAGYSDIRRTRGVEELYPRYNATLTYGNGDTYVGPVIIYYDGRLLKHGVGIFNGKSGVWDETPVSIEYEDDIEGGKKMTRHRKQKIDPKKNRRTKRHKYVSNRNHY